jgi:homeobox protein cut-like
MDDLIQERVTQKENELNAEYDERMRNYEEREKDLQRQVQTFKDQIRDLHTSNESTQAKLLDASQRQGELSLTYPQLTSENDVAAKLAELDLVVTDLNRANERVATVERRNVGVDSIVYSDPLRSSSVPRSRPSAVARSRPRSEHLSASEHI